MGKVVLSMFVSLDGYIEAANGQLVVPAYSADLQRYWIDNSIERCGVLMYGRTCYEGMAAFWTSPNAPADEARRLTETPKVVFSRTLAGAGWANTRILSGDLTEEVARLKRETDKDLGLIGGAAIANAFMQRGLIDEYKILINPVLLGGGKRLFAGTERQKLNLLSARPLENGPVLLTYAPKR